MLQSKTSFASVTASATYGHSPCVHTVTAPVYIRLQDALLLMAPLIATNPRAAAIVRARRADLGREMRAGCDLAGTRPGDGGRSSSSTNGNSSTSSSTNRGATARGRNGAGLRGPDGTEVEIEISLPQVAADYGSVTVM